MPYLKAFDLGHIKDFKCIGLSFISLEKEKKIVQNFKYQVCKDKLF